MTQPFFAVRWISVADKLPDRAGTYLIYAPSLDPDKPALISVWYCPKDGWGLVPAWQKAVTHWMHLPAAPKPDMTPNAETQAALRDAQAGRVTRCEDKDDLFGRLGI